MYLRNEISKEKKLVGKCHTMSFAADTTRELFQGFMPRRNEIANTLNTDILCVQEYPPHFFAGFNPGTSFLKWGAVEVTSLDNVPAGMETLIIPEGLYAVFLFKGTNADAMPFFQNIYMNWFPSSGYEVDHRPHFDVLGAKYKNNAPDSEEEIWIPIRKK